jgi:hypothetical protein
MKETLADIRLKFMDNLYQNEEHVRFALVGRVLQALGWNVWNPMEVYTEYKPIPTENQSRVDYALFTGSEIPWVFIEVKAVGLVDTNLPAIERQMRDYNTNLTAMFSVITDGQKWRFYYSQTGGEFSQKLFKVIDLLNDDVGDCELSLRAFLSKSEIENGNAEQEAKDYLKFTLKQRAMDGALPQARRMVDEPPFPSLPQALIDLVGKAGHKITLEEAVEFIKSYKPVERPPKVAPTLTPVHVPTGTAATSDIVPGSAALSQILEVSGLMLKGRDYVSAVNEVARHKDVHPNTVRDKCTRQLGLDTEQFKSLLREKNQIVSFLKAKFPEYSSYIVNHLDAH